MRHAAHTGRFIAVAVLAGVAVLLAVTGWVYARMRRKLAVRIGERFAAEELLGVTLRANFFGVRSRGGAQIRGNGALVLTRRELCFIRAVPEKTFTIPIGAVRRVSLPRAFNGKSALTRLLCVAYVTESGEDAMGWAVRDPERWKAAIEGAAS